MSLKDTIRGARDEVAASGNPFESVGGKDKGKQESGGSATKRRYARSTAANRKPSREAAAGVRVVSSSGKAKSTANMTKEERKEEKRLEREREDRRYSVTQMILEKDEEYQKARKFWWRFLIGGFALMVIALGLYGYVSNVGPSAPPIAYIGSIVAMVAAYGVIIFGIIYDFRKIRPRRRLAEQRVASMTDKKIQTIVNRGSI
jgi:hypothetical protein